MHQFDIQTEITLLVKLHDQVDVIARRGLDVHTLFEGRFYNRGKVITLGALAIVVFSGVAILINGAIEKVLYFFYLILNPR